MNLWFRLLYLLLSFPFRPRLQLLDPSRVSMRVLPTDLDLNFHMNNGRYLTLMDLGRTDLVLRNGLLRTVLSRGWRPVLGEATIRFLRPLPPGRRFDLETRIESWDEKWFYLEQSFWCGEQLMARAKVKALFQRGRSKVPPSEVLEALSTPEK